MFKRRRHQDEHDDTQDVLDTVDEDQDELDDLDDEEVADDVDDIDDADEATGSRPLPEGGPHDAADIDDDLTRIDLGGLQVLPVEGVEVRLEVDQESGVVQGVTLVAGESAMQVGAFAAPRTEGIWDEVRTEIASQITAQGGTVDHREGPFGPELRANLQGTDEQGRRVTQPARFLGVDGPRWFLRGLMTGPGVSNDDAAVPLLEQFRGIVVVRGTDPRAPHEPLPITLPSEISDDATPEAAGHDLNPFRRGPEITEIR